MEQKINALIQNHEYSKALTIIEENKHLLSEQQIKLFQAKSYFGLEFFNKAEALLNELVEQQPNNEVTFFYLKFIYIIMMHEHQIYLN